MNKNKASTMNEIHLFMDTIKINLPKGFIEFYKKHNGGEIIGVEKYTVLWSLAEMTQMNIDYNVEFFAPEFFLFGSDGGGTAFAIEKISGYIFEIPFVGMSKDDAVFLSKDFDNFVEIQSTSKF